MVKFEADPIEDNHLADREGNGLEHMQALNLEKIALNRWPSSLASLDVQLWAHADERGRLMDFRSRGPFSAALLGICGVHHMMRCKRTMVLCGPATVGVSEGIGAPNAFVVHLEHRLGERDAVVRNQSTAN